MSHLSLRQLSREEVLTHYLPLRKEILQDELRWTKETAAHPKELFDEYDDLSEAYGILVGSELVGAVRLIHGKSEADLPSGRCFGGLAPGLSSILNVEISRLLIERAYRSLGLARILIRKAVAAALSSRADRAIISVADTPESAELLGDLGFVRVRAGERYEDSKLRPTVAAATFYLDLGNLSAARRKRFESSLLERDLEDAFRKQTA